jgi:streptogramin lyase
MRTPAAAPAAVPVAPRSSGFPVGCIVGIGAALVLVLVGIAGVAILFRSATPVASPPVVSSAIATAPAKATASATPGSDVAKVVLTFGDEGNGAGQTEDARSIGVDMDENVFLADYSTARVQKFDATGKFQWIIEIPKNSFSGDKNIWSLVCDTKGTLWVARTGDLLQFSTADGKAKGTIKGDYDTSWFHYLAIDPVGNMAAEHTAAGDTTILFMDPTGKIKQRIKHDETRGMAMDGAGNVYVDDQFDGTIEVLDPKGATKTKFGSKKDKHTSSPGAIAVDGKGHIYVETSEGVNVFDSGGGYIATLPEVRSVRDIEVSVKGNIFALDNGGKVRKLEPGPKLN